MNIDANAVWEIIGDHPRFSSPFTEPSGYYIWSHNGEIPFGNAEIQEYKNKLKYMAEHLDTLLQQAFDPDFYMMFYGIDRSAVSSSDEMCARLTVDSFVLDAKDGSVSCCLSNPQFMQGHYIECVWNSEWELICSNIC